MAHKKYKLIYCDPPWQFNNKNTGGSMKSSAEAKYNTMTIEDLKNLDVESLCDDDCVLIMWWVGSMPQEAIDLVNAWGFKLKNMNGFVWKKLTKRLLDFLAWVFGRVPVASLPLLPRAENLNPHRALFAPCNLLLLAGIAKSRKSLGIWRLNWWAMFHGLKCFHAGSLKAGTYSAINAKAV
jgi:hypothetical protein